VHPFLDEPGPVGFAHRGGTRDGLENSMEAFARAVAAGFRHLETDVHATADGVLVALHDETLDRVADARGEVARLPWRVVHRARIGGRETIPRLVEVLDAWPDVRVNVDPKSDAAVEPLVAAVRDAGALDRVCVGSFSDARLARVRAALGPAVCTSLGPAEVRRLRLASWRLRPRTRLRLGGACVQIPPRHRGIPLVERRLVALAHARGLPVHVWTIDDPADMRRLLDLGVDGLMSGDLHALRGVLAERGAWPPG
jgi:glycerophosphoryl diester phosphodiesterase